MRYEASYASLLKVHVRYYVYEPKVVIRSRGMVFIFHDLSEDASYYDHFASYLLNQGYIVVVSDIPGHGSSLIDFEQGYFGKENVIDCLIEDMHHLRQMIFKNHDDLPVFFLGIGLGGSLCRIYASKYGDYLQGLIIISTMYKVKYRRIRELFIKTLIKMHGSRYHTDTKLLKLNKWREMHVLKPFSYTLQAMKDIYEIVTKANSLKTLSTTSLHLPILLLAGNKDAQVRKGKDTSLIYQTYRYVGITDISKKLYENVGHDFIHSSIKEEVYSDIVHFLNEKGYIY